MTQSQSDLLREIDAVALRLAKGESTQPYTVDIELSALLRRCKSALEASERDAPAWIIENALIKIAPYPALLYFCGWKNRNSYLPLWLKDVEQAIRFCRKQDAESVGRVLGVSVEIVQHVWVSAIDAALASDQQKEK